MVNSWEPLTIATNTFTTDAQGVVGPSLDYL